MGKRRCVGELKNKKREFILDIWGKRGATYGEKGVCRRIKKNTVVEWRRERAEEAAREFANVRVEVSRVGIQQLHLLRDGRCDRTMLVPHVRHVVARVQVRTAAVVSEEGATALDDEEWLTVGVGDRKSRTKIATSRIEQRLLLPSCR